MKILNMNSFGEKYGQTRCIHFANEIESININLNRNERRCQMMCQTEDGRELEENVGDSRLRGGGFIGFFTKPMDRVSTKLKLNEKLREVNVLVVENIHPPCIGWIDTM